MKLTTNLIAEFSKLRADKSALEKREKEMGRDIKDEMKARDIDEFAPKDSQLKLVKIEYPQSAMEYKELCEQAYKDLYGKSWQIKLDRARAEKTKTIVKLEIELNEHYLAEKKTA